MPKTSPAVEWPIFIVSLKDATARRERLEEQLGKLNLKYEFIDAVDGRNGLPYDAEAMVDRVLTQENLGRDMANSEYGCALSHIHIYEEIISKNLPGAVILEDDAIIGENFSKFLQEKTFLSGDLVQLSHEAGRINRFARPLNKYESFATYALSTQANLAVAYSISAKAASYILKNGLPIIQTADWPCDIMPLKPSVCLPIIVDHLKPLQGGDSFIEDGRTKFRSEAKLKTESASMPSERRNKKRLSWSYLQHKCEKIFRKGYLKEKYIKLTTKAVP